MFNAGDTVEDRYDHQLWYVINPDDRGLVEVESVDPHGPFGSFVAENLRRVEIFTYYDLCAADQDARERGCDTPDVLSRIWQEETTLYNIYVSFTLWGMALTEDCAWVHQARIIREVTV